MQNRNSEDHRLVKLKENKYYMFMKYYFLLFSGYSSVMVFIIGKSIILGCSHFKFICCFAVSCIEGREEQQESTHCFM
jgi:hypothetical protein